MERVRVRGEDGKPHKELFVALRYNKALVEVEGLKTKRRITVHCTRIIRKGDDMVPKKAIVGVPLDFKKMKGERWTKTMKFDHKGIRADAHVMVDKAGKTYTAFNTYNGSLGRKGKMGTKFKFKDYDQLAIRLQERGYAKVKAAAKAAKAPKVAKTVRVTQPPKVVAAPAPIQPAEGPVVPSTPKIVVKEPPPTVVPKPE